VTRILVHALVGVDADRSGAGEPECAARQHPEIDEIQRQPFAQLELDRLRQPPLEDVEDEQCARDHPEHAELREKRLEIAPRQRVVERLVPAVQPDLPVRRRQDDHKDPARERQQRVAHGRRPQCSQHHAGLRHEARTGDLVAVGPAWVFRLGAHRLPRFDPP
jgi:hypothetical protein